MKHWLKRSIIVPLVLLILNAYPNDIDAGVRSSFAESNRGLMNQIISIATHESKFQTTLNIVGNGNIPDYITKTIDSPPRMVIDIFCVADPFESTAIDVKKRDIKCIRIGYHPDKIRLVLDIQGAEMPDFMTRFADHELSVFLKSRCVANNEKKEADEAFDGEANQKVSVFEKPVERVQESDSLQDSKFPGDRDSVTKKTALLQETPKNNDVISEKKEKGLSQAQGASEADGLEKATYERKLINIVTNDDEDDTIFFISSLNDYRVGNWSGAIKNLTHLINAFPTGRYAERAYFLLAESYERLYSDSISVHFKVIKDHYEDAMSQFPTSEYIPDALLGVGNLYFHKKQYHEALGYYNLVLKKNKCSFLALKALTQKGKILLLRKKREEAMAVASRIENLVCSFPDMPERTEASVQMAKIFYEMNNFHKSMNVLNEIIKGDPENIYLYPETSLYLGYNDYQLGNDTRARENLFRFYNCCPEGDNNHLLLSRIGDTYRNDSLMQDAAKIYQLVFERYPDTEGAFISQIRLAEIYEEGDLETVREKIGSSKQIYENIVNKIDDDAQMNFLKQFALLKLSLFYQKKKDYKTSFVTIKKLLKKYPQTTLIKEGKYILLETLNGFLKEEMELKKYKNIIKFYLNEQDLFLLLNEPELFIMVSRALVHENLEEAAMELFRKADTLLLDTEKPPDLLFAVGRDLFEKEEFEGALARLNLLIDNHPSSKYVFYAYQLKGRMLLKQNNYPMAAEMFSAALTDNVTECNRVRVLIDKAKALIQCGNNERALNAIQEADGMKNGCDSLDCQLYQDIGDLYFNLGFTKEALHIYNQGVETVKDKDDKSSLKLKIARCLWLLDKKQDSFAIYERISDFDDPFWSNLAKEALHEMEFQKEMERMN